MNKRDSQKQRKMSLTISLFTPSRLFLLTWIAVKSQGVEILPANSLSHVSSACSINNNNKEKKKKQSFPNYSILHSLHIDGLPIFVPLPFNGAISLSHSLTPSSTPIPLDPPPLVQSGSSYPSTYFGCLLLELELDNRWNCLNLWASVASACPDPQSIGTAIGFPGLDGLADQSYHHPIWSRRIW